MPVQGFYDAEFAPWAQGMRRIGTMIAAQPVMQANAQARQQQAGLTAARMQTEGAQARQYDAQAGETLRKGQLVEALQKAMPQAQQDYLAGKTDSPAIREYIGAASGLTGINGDDIAEMTRKGLGTAFAVMGKQDQAANVSDPVAMEKTRADIASREKIAGERGVILSPGSGQWKNGVQVANQPSAASQREGSYRETSTDYPAVAGTEAVEPSTTGSLWWKKEVPGKPAVPGTPARTVKERISLGTAALPIANQTQDPNDTEDATDPGGPEEQGEPMATTPTAAAAPEAPVASAPSFAEKVRVQHPDGRTGMIPKAQLKAAIAQGYKLAQ